MPEQTGIQDIVPDDKAHSVLTAELKGLQNRFPGLRPEDAFVAWFVTAYLTGDEIEATTTLTGMAGSADAVYITSTNVYVVQGTSTR